MEGHQYPGDVAIFGVGKPLIITGVIFQAFCIKFLVGFTKAKVGSGRVRIILNGKRKSLTSSTRHYNLTRKGGGDRIFKQAAGRLIIRVPQMDRNGAANRKQI